MKVIYHNNGKINKYMHQKKNKIRHSHFIVKGCCPHVTVGLVTNWLAEVCTCANYIIIITAHNCIHNDKEDPLLFYTELTD